MTESNYKNRSVALGVTESFQKNGGFALGVTESDYKNHAVALGVTVSFPKKWEFCPGGDRENLQIQVSKNAEGVLTIQI